jgi:hypothetical protein
MRSNYKGIWEMGTSRIRPVWLRKSRLLPIIAQYSAWLDLGHGIQFSAAWQLTGQPTANPSLARFEAAPGLGRLEIKEDS